MIGNDLCSRVLVRRTGSRLVQTHAAPRFFDDCLVVEHENIMICFLAHFSLVIRLVVITKNGNFINKIIDFSRKDVKER